jgi:hypothetical protein
MRDCVDRPSNGGKVGADGRGGRGIDKAETETGETVGFVSSEGSGKADVDGTEAGGAGAEVGGVGRVEVDWAGGVVRDGIEGMEETAGKTGVE